MAPITRRDFLRGVGRASAALAAGGGASLVPACAGAPCDLLIRNAVIYDGSGGEPFPGEVAVAAGRILAVGRRAARRARRTIDAGGKALAPGFVDIHEHTSDSLLVNPRAESAVRQGVTTLVSGQCGDSPFPLSEDAALALAEDLKDRGLELDWRDARGFFARIEQSGTAVNYTSFVGQGAVRAAAMGLGNRPPSPAELDAMRRLVRESMEAGALGVSSGLEYTPGSWATTEEIVELCRVAAARGGLYATHMRDEESGVLEAVDEAIRIARASGTKLQVSHLKVGYPENWPKFDELLRRIEAAAASGLDVRADRYPYIAWSTGLSQYFPLWSREGSAADFAARLASKDLQPRLRAEVEAVAARLGSWDKALIASVALEADRRFEGMTVRAAADSVGKDPYTFMRDLLIEEKARVSAITFAMSEDHLRRLLAHPLVGVGSDGSALAPYGPLAKGKPHPRHYGAFPRALGRYVREEKVTSLAEMVRKITSMPAERLGLVRRGRVRPGWSADLVLFDPDRVADRATWTEPAQYPQGIDWVVVNGDIVVEAGEHTGRLPGRVLRKDAKGAVA